MVGRFFERGLGGSACIFCLASMALLVPGTRGRDAALV